MSVAVAARRVGRGTSMGWLAPTAAGVSVACAVLAVALHVRSPAAATLSVADLIVAVAYPVLAAVVVRAQPRNRAGWLLLTTALLGPYLLAGIYALDAVAVRGRDGAVVSVAAWLAMWGFAPYRVLVALVPLYLPDGIAVGRHWNRYARGMAALQLAGLLAAMFAARPPDVSPALSNPLAVSSPFVAVLLAVAGFGSFAVGGPAAALAMVQRFRSATGTDRARLG